MTFALSVDQISKHFGGVTALDEVSFQMAPGEVVGLIGPNGSGKTTLLNVISGFYQADQGKIHFAGERIDRFPPYEISKRGMGRTFQITKTFHRLTVLENMLVPALAKWKSKESDSIKRGMELLDHLKIGHLKEELAEHLSGGQQKLLEFGKMLMLDPKMVLLDEPFAGVHPDLMIQLHENVLQLKREGKPVLLVSHDMGSIFSICDRVMVLDKGRLVMDGVPEVVKQDEKVIQAYLGENE